MVLIGVIAIVPKVVKSLWRLRVSLISVRFAHTNIPRRKLREKGCTRRISADAPVWQTAKTNYWCMVLCTTWLALAASSPIFLRCGCHGWHFEFMNRYSNACRLQAMPPTLPVAPLPWPRPNPLQDKCKELGVPVSWLRSPVNARWHVNWRGFGGPLQDLPATDLALNAAYDLKLPPHFKDEDFMHLAKIIAYAARATVGVRVQQQSLP